MLYDFDAEKLVGETVFASYSDATASLEDVLILGLDVPSAQEKSIAGKPV